MNCRYENKSSGWFDPVQKHLEKHYKSRFSASVVIVKQYVFLARELNDLILSEERKSCYNGTIEECLSLKKKINKSIQIKLIELLIKKLCFKKYKKANRYEFKLVEVFPIPYTKRNIRNLKKLKRVRFRKEGLISNE